MMLAKINSGKGFIVSLSCEPFLLQIQHIQVAIRKEHEARHENRIPCNALMVDL